MKEYYSQFGNVEFRETMDPHSREIVINGRWVGDILWYNCEWRVVLSSFDESLIDIPFSVIEAILAEKKRLTKEMMGLLD